jgi:hypothetical protein
MAQQLRLELGIDQMWTALQPQDPKHVRGERETGRRETKRKQARDKANGEERQRLYAGP